MFKKVNLVFDLSDRLVWKFPQAPRESGLEGVYENGPEEKTRIFRARTDALLSEAQLRKMEEESDVVLSSKTGLIPTPEQIKSMELPQRIITAEQVALSNNEAFLRSHFTEGKEILIHDENSEDPNATVVAVVSKFIPGIPSKVSSKIQVIYTNAEGNIKNRKIHPLSAVAHNKLRQPPTPPQYGRSKEIDLSDIETEVKSEGNGKKAA